MENMTNEAEILKKYAEEKLRNHVDELNTRYQNETIDRKTMTLAYAEHQDIFNQELETKIQSLLSAESNPWLREELESIKNKYITKLNSNQS